MGLNIENLLHAVVLLIAVVLILMAVAISSRDNASRMITDYKIQALLLFLLTIFTALELGDAVIGFLALPPLVMLVLIRALLAQATVVTSGITVWQRLKRAFFESIRPNGQPFGWSWKSRPSPRLAATIYPAKDRTIEEATIRWLRATDNRDSTLSVAFSFLALALAYFFAFSLIKNQPDVANNLAVSLSLVLIGLLIMLRKKDIISQIVGLLVMEHGMFLAAIRVLRIPSLSLLFVISLFLYLGITIVMLVYLLPELDRTSGSLMIEQQKILREEYKPEASLQQLLVPENGWPKGE
ncbi:MAG: hypothetical protein WCS37_03490 [Chloroflexota bacterium]|nr:hypothetical protein [Chloroflexota bacterium]